jgi:DNA-binding MarR family transcriptional regulator
MAPPPPPPPLDLAARNTLLTRLRRGNAIWRRYDPQITAHSANLVLAVAQHPGVTQSSLADLLGLPPATVSRAAAAVSEYPTKERAGSGLVRAQVRRDDRRSHGLWLTPKGEALIEELAENYLGAE